MTDCGKCSIEIFETSQPDFTDSAWFKMRDDKPQDPVINAAQDDPYIFLYKEDSYDYGTYFDFVSS